MIDVMWVVHVLLCSVVLFFNSLGIIYFLFSSIGGAYSSGIFDGCNQENPDIDHAVVLVGYGSDNGRDYWTVRNSWSPSWGEIGYIRVLRTEDEENRCGMDTNPQDGTACAGDDEPKRVCGTCGILYDSCYPTDATLV